ncbi:MAG: HEPN domain-containing protein [Flavobacterium nitrogenifigens]|uniref:HEPN domain-containing protein n=1 Tax=Flavobacterium nitrogenifigens TaxID=1617283 RepID=UPI002809E2F6|nr:HEPN domain-containing protein [Flavobacterium nitrogenifigens]MDQ8015281.1 HEPN domain-containing protein [Flavobacterium nitrogenifigens]MDQ8053437.1 HEPN domain-containing protein [Pedobacter sp.]
MHRAKLRFDDAVLRVRNLDSLYIHLTATLHYPATDVSDILRSEVVYVISAFDKFMHDIVKQGMIDIFLGLRATTPAYKNFTINLSQLDAITNATSIPSPVDVFERIIIQNHSHLSFQDPEKLNPALSLIWAENHKWFKIATCMRMSESDVKVELKNIVMRRNQIVHEGDLDPLSGTLQVIRPNDVTTSVDFIERLGNCIYTLI